MSSRIKQVFIVLLSFSESLVTKCVSLKDEPCMVRLTLIDLNPVVLRYYPFMIILSKCTGSCNVLFPKICVPKKTKDINVKVFDMVENRNEAKTLVKHTSCNSKCKVNGPRCNPNQKWHNKTCQCEYKPCCQCWKDYSCNPTTSIYKNNKYFKSIADTGVITCDETTDIASTKIINTIGTNVTSSASINSHSKNVRYKIDCYVFHAVLLAIILLFVITIICYH